MYICARASAGMTGQTKRGNPACAKDLHDFARGSANLPMLHFEQADIGPKASPGVGHAGLRVGRGDGIPRQFRMGCRLGIVTEHQVQA